MDPGQEAPRLENQYDADPLLREWLSAHLDPGLLAEEEPSLREMGELARGRLRRLQLADRDLEPRLTRWDPWGRRIDHIEHTPLWQEAARVAARHGLVALPYEDRHGAAARLVQAALVYLFVPSTDMYGCPLAMSDGAARALLESGEGALVERAVPRLISRDPGRAWTSGQWMTEVAGGSDVGETATVARPDGQGGWTLHGRKWFASAAAAPMALVLARPQGAPEGSGGLMLFYLETRAGTGPAPGVGIDRLKEKLGTRKLPTGEITLDGAAARAVGGAGEGLRRISPVLTVTRVWNALTSVAYMRRGLALAVDYAARRRAFGGPLLEKPLHRDTLAGMEAELWAGFHLAFHTARLLGRSEAGELDAEGAVLLRLLVSVSKVTTARQAITVTSEVVEAFGGAGYVEETGVPALLRDAQVLPIWEGTTNVLSLDVLRSLRSGAALAALQMEVERCASAAPDPRLTLLVGEAAQALQHAESWLGAALESGGEVLEAGARRFALTLGRATALALAATTAQHGLAAGNPRGLAACRRFARHGVDRIAEIDPAEARLLVGAGSGPQVPTSASSSPR